MAQRQTRFSTFRAVFRPFTRKCRQRAQIQIIIVLYKKFKNEHAEVRSMTIETTLTDKTLTVKVSGRMDTTTAPQLEAELKRKVGGNETLILDFDNLEYLSSAGLRVVLAAQKVMNRQGKMIVRHVNETIMDIFEVTGFVDILTIE